MATHEKLCYLLTLADTFTGWAEAFTIPRETADMGAQILLDHIIL